MANIRLVQENPKNLMHAHNRVGGSLKMTTLIVSVGGSTKGTWVTA